MKGNKKSMQNSDHANKGIGVGSSPKNGPKRETGPDKMFVTGVGSRPKSTKND